MMVNILLATIFKGWLFEAKISCHVVVWLNALRGSSVGVVCVGPCVSAYVLYEQACEYALDAPRADTLSE